jgi:acetyl esterase/lipase
VYEISDEVELPFDLYLPQNTTSDKKLPAVILVHGEAHFNLLKDLGQYYSLGRLVAASGMAAVAFNRRMIIKGAAITDAINDINNLIAYLIKNADKFNIVKSKLAIWSIPAGVPFGLYEGMRNNP